MNSSAAIELVIALREHGLDEDPRVARMALAMERHAAQLRERAKRRRRGYECLKCRRENRRGLLCHDCASTAPARVREAFAKAGGLDSMRRAAAMVRAWVNESRNARRAA